MKKYLIIAGLFLMFSISVSELYAQGEPPHPNNGSDPGSGNTPVGGGAPVGEGLISLITMAALFGSAKLMQNFIKENSETKNK